MSGRDERAAARMQADTDEALSLPQNVEAERGLLGALIHRNDLAAEIAQVLEPAHFFFADHQEIYRCALALIAQGRPATAITVKSYLPAEIGGTRTIEYLAALVADGAVPASVPGYAQIVREMATRRDLVAAGERLVEQARNADVETSPVDMIEAAEGALLSARAATPDSHLVSMTAAEGSAWMLERVRNLRDGLVESTAIPSGIADLDRVTSGGFQRGQLWLMAGRPGMGKTVAMTSLSRFAARDYGVLVFQCEVTRDQQWSRYLADLAYLHTRPLTFGQIMAGKDLDDEDLWRLEDAQKRLAQLHLRVECEPSISVAQIAFGVKAEKKRLAKKGKRLGVVFIDYLKYIRSSDRYQGKRVLEIGEIAGALKQLAKAEDICVVLLAQLNRGVEAREREDRRPTPADLRDSGELEEAADTILLLYREAFYLQKKLRGKDDPELSARLFDCQNSLDFILGKNRSGPECTLNLWCNVASSSIAQISRGPA